MKSRVDRRREPFLSGTKAFSSRSQRIALSGLRSILALSGMREVPARTPVGISLSRDGRSLADGCSVPAATLRVWPAESQFSAARRPAIRFQASAIAAPLRESTGEEAIASRRRRPDAPITRSSPPPCARRLVRTSGRTTPAPLRSLQTRGDMRGLAAAPPGLFAPDGHLAKEVRILEVATVTKRETG